MLRIRPLTCTIVTALSLTLSSVVAARDPFIKGADLSILKEAEDHGVQYKVDGKTTDAMQIFADSGCNLVRLRLFANPSGKDGQVNSLEYTIAIARRVKQHGLRFLLDLHYSDGWADGDHQVCPAAWKSLTRAELVKRVHDYTLETIQAFERAGCRPDIVAVGNEITNGMIWPFGGPMGKESTWPDLIELLQSGISAVRESAPKNEIQVMIHLHCGGDVVISDWFLKHCNAANLHYNLIGLSYYPFWHGTLHDLQLNLASIATKYDKDILVVETGYDFAGTQGKLEFPTTLAGQKEFLKQLMTTVNSTPKHHGVGVIYWEPAWIEGGKWSAPKWSGMWEHRALFDDQGNALPALDAFRFTPAEAR